MIWSIIWQMRRLNKSVATKIQYENPVKGNSILINEVYIVKKKKKLLHHVLVILLYKLFSFISIYCYTNYFLSFQQVKCSILDIKSTFFLHIILYIKFIIWYSLLGMSKKHTVPISCIYISKQNSINSSKLLLRLKKKIINIIISF